MRFSDSGSRAIGSYRRTRPWARIARPESEEIPRIQAPLTVDPVGPAQRVPADQPLAAIDLLNPEPAVILDVERIDWALSFGFAGGDITGLLGLALQRAPVAASDFQPEAFAAGLFVSDLIKTCMRVRIGGFEPQIGDLHVHGLEGR